jgi:hypothetical protein
MERWLSFGAWCWGAWWVLSFLLIVAVVVVVGMRVTDNEALWMPVNFHKTLT